MGGGIYVNSSDVTIGNTILWADTAYGFPNELYGSVIHVTYSDIQYGWAGEGNIDTNPRFRDPSGGDYHIMATVCGDLHNSPCIDAGNPAISDSILDCDWGLGTERSDMGAYGGGTIQTDITGPDSRPDLPAGICLSQNYPNPFNSSTVIGYSLSSVSFITIDIYGIGGQMISSIFEGIQQAGRHTVIWNADDYPSGIYFARITSDEGLHRSIRMSLVK